MRFLVASNSGSYRESSRLLSFDSRKKRPTLQTTLPSEIDIRAFRSFRSFAILDGLKQDEIDETFRAEEKLL